MACQCVIVLVDTEKEGRRGARANQVLWYNCEHAASHEPLPMNPFVLKGMAREGTGVG